MIALDLFAGTGWGVACKWLGIEEYGVDNMREVVATRELNGMTTLYEDVWDGLIGDDLIYQAHDTLIASPPCQTFSMAGRGAGRDALTRVLELIEEEAYKRPQDLHDFGQRTDPRTALVLTPLAHVWRDRPMYVVFEQVPPVLPVWEACAAVMRTLGYSVWTGKLHAEQYGVPQTRTRAILIARRDGIPATPPKPTHNAYNHRAVDGGRYALDTLLPWVSMAEALGWGLEKGLSPLRSNYGTGGDPAARGERDGNEPAPTVTSKADRNKWATGRNLSLDEAATLQTYPMGWGFTDRPAVTVGNAVGRGLIGGQGAKDSVLRAMEDGTFIPSSHAEGDSYAERTRITPAEAATLQSYPPFRFTGTKGKQFLQIGNAVPPFLARAILRDFL